MSKSNSLKELYKLKYDTHTPQTSLINWYNQLIDKSTDELDITDVSKMFRQNILPSCAVERAIDIFVTDPFVGEMYDGELLSLFVTYQNELIKSKKCRTLMAVLDNVESDISKFDWFNPEDEADFKRNLVTLKNVLDKHN